MPPPGGILREDLPRLARQARDQRQRQARPRFAVRPGVGLAGLRAADQPIDRGLIDRLLTAAVGREVLHHEHRQRLHRRIPPLAVRRQQRLDLIEQLWAGQQIEHRARIRMPRMVLHAALLWCGKVLARMHEGWLLEWWLRCCNLQPITRGSQPRLFLASSKGCA
jgi:hypothetical protein